MLEKQVETPAAFKRWLEGEGKKNNVGRTSSAKRCPLATFLTETMGVQGVVNRRRMEIILGDFNFVQVDTPPWAKEFINEVDGTPFDDDVAKDDTTNITAGEALEILAKVEKRLIL